MQLQPETALINQTTLKIFKPLLAAIALATLAACGGGDGSSTGMVTIPAPEPSHLQDTRVFTPVVEGTFAALNGSTVDTGPLDWRVEQYGPPHRSS